MEKSNRTDIENFYFDENGFFTIATGGYSWAECPPDAIRVSPYPVPAGKWPRLNVTHDGWDHVDDYFDAEAWLNGESRRIGYHGPLRAGWSLEPPPPPPDTRTEEEKQWEKDQMEAMDSLADIVAASTILATRAINRDTSKMADTDVIAIARGLPKAYRVWAPGGVYASGEWFWFPAIDTILYEQRQPGPVTGQEHQPPGDENMYAVYRPVDPAAGTEADPKTLILGMTATAGLHFIWAGALWKCLRPLDVVFRSREPGAAGMETDWERVRDV